MEEAHEGDGALTLVVEWRHLEVHGQTCERCRSTGGELRKAIRELSTEFARSGVHIEFREIRQGPFDIDTSNGIFMDGEPIERLLQGARVTRSCCDSCGELLATPTACRALEVDGTLYEAIPAELIGAALRAAVSRRRLEARRPDEER